MRSTVASPLTLNILWHDDELGRGDRYDLEPWMAWLEEVALETGAAVAYTSTLEELATLLGTDGRTWHLILFDMLLQHEQARTFVAFGFPEEKLLRLDAGVQLASLLRNAVFDARRPAWLQRLSSTPVVLLSSSTVSRDLIFAYLDNDRREGVYSMLKELEVVEGSARVTVSADRAIRHILRAIRHSLLPGDNGLNTA